MGAPVSPNQSLQGEYMIGRLMPCALSLQLDLVSILAAVDVSSFALWNVSCHMGYVFTCITSL
jgi:hypothetical protein